MKRKNFILTIAAFIISAALFASIPLPAKVVKPHTIEVSKPTGYIPNVGAYVRVYQWDEQAIAYPVWTDPTGHPSPWHTYFAWQFARCKVNAKYYIGSQLYAVIELAESGYTAYQISWPVNLVSAFGTQDYMAPY